MKCKHGVLTAAASHGGGGDAVVVVGGVLVPGEGWVGGEGGVHHFLSKGHTSRHAGGRLGEGRVLGGLK